MQRIKDERIRVPRPGMLGDDLAFGHDHDSVDVAFDRHHLKRERAWNAIAVSLKRNGLVLVHGSGEPDHTGIETMLGKRKGRRLFFGKAFSDDERAKE